MFIKELRLKNFMKHSSLNVRFSNLTLFYGQNGAGKSSILEAITYALYGTTSRKTNISDIIKKNTNESYVKLITDEFTVFRGLKPRTVELDVGDKKVTTIRDVNNTIEQMLGSSKHHFLNLIYIAQGKLLNIVEATPAERKKILDKLFFNDIPLDMLYDRFRNLSSKYKFAKEEFEKKDAYIENKETLKKKATQIKKKITKLQKEINEIEKQLNEKKVQIRKLRDMYNEYSSYTHILSQLDNKKKLAEEYKEELDGIEYDKLSQQYKEYYDKLSKIDELKQYLVDYEFLLELKEYFELFIEFDVDKYMKELSKRPYDSSVINKLKSSRKRLYDMAPKSEYEDFEREIKLHEANVLEEGYNEFAVRDEDYIKKFKIVFDNYQKIKDVMNKYEINNSIDLESVISKMKKIKDNVSEYDNVKNKLFDAKSKLDRYTDIQKRFNKTMEEIQKLQSKVKKLKYSDVDLDNLTSSINFMSTDISEQEKIFYSKRNELIDLNGELSTIEREIEDIEKKLSVAINYEKKYHVFDELKFVFSKDGLPDLMREIAYAPLKKEFSYYMNNFGFSEIELDYTLSFVDKISNISIDGLSGGQKVAASLALRFALLGVLGIRFPILLIDEPSIHLDDERVTSLVNMIERISTMCQVIVVTHNERFLNLQGSIYRIM